MAAATRRGERTERRSFQEALNSYDAHVPHDCHDIAECKARGNALAANKSRWPATEYVKDSSNSPKKGRDNQKDRRRSNMKDRKQVEREERAQNGSGISGKTAGWGGPDSACSPGWARDGANLQGDACCGVRNPNSPSGQRSLGRPGTGRLGGVAPRRPAGAPGFGPHDDVNMEEVKVSEDQVVGDPGEFVCKICQTHVVGRGPKLTSCSHLFCGDCIAQWFARQPAAQGKTWAERAQAAGKARAAPCPVCKQMLSEEKDLSPLGGADHLLLCRMLFGLKIKCANHPEVRAEGTCDWVGLYGDYKQHLSRCSCCNPPVLEEAVRAPDGGGWQCQHEMEMEAQRSPQEAQHQQQLQQPERRLQQQQEPFQQMQHQAQQPAPQLHQYPPHQQPQLLSTSGQHQCPPESPSLSTCPAVCVTCPFEPYGPNTVRVRAGDMVQVLESTESGWAYCNNLTTRDTGWAPTWVVQPAQSEEEVPAAQIGRPLATIPCRAPAAEQPGLSAEAAFAWAARGTELALTEVTCFFSQMPGAEMSQLSLVPGEMVEVLERHPSGWTYGRKAIPTVPPQQGWFPEWACAVRKPASGEHGRPMPMWHSGPSELWNTVAEGR